MIHAAGISRGMFFAIKPSSGRRACTGGHLTAKEIERYARDEAIKPTISRLLFNFAKASLLISNFYVYLTHLTRDYALNIIFLVI